MSENDQFNPFTKMLEKSKRREDFIKKITDIKESIDELFKSDFLTIPNSNDVLTLVTWVSELGKDNLAIDNPYEPKKMTIATALLLLKETINMRVRDLEDKAHAIWKIGKQSKSNPFDKDPLPMPHRLWL